jgi:DNA polymerase I-like protein with 3'-5' exonuclease and polymerase domains
VTLRRSDIHNIPIRTGEGRELAQAFAPTEMLIPGHTFASIEMRVAEDLKRATGWQASNRKSRRAQGSKRRGTR